MAHVHFTDAAKSDLRKIADYTFEQHGLRQVEIYQNKLFRGLNGLLSFEGLDKVYDGKTTSCLRARIERHMVFFDRKEDGGLLVRRILGVQMDFDRHL